MAQRRAWPQLEIQESIPAFTFPNHQITKSANHQIPKLALVRI